MITVGAKVRSLGALYVHNVDGNSYRKVHNGTVLAVLKYNDMGTQTVCKVATKYGTCFVNPSQLALVSL